MGNSINMALSGTSQFNSLSSWTPTRLVGAVINLILVVTGLIFFFLLLFGGLQFILAGGGSDKQGSQRAQKAVTGALIGLLIVFGVYAVIVLAGNFLGVNLLVLNIVNV